MDFCRRFLAKLSFVYVLKINFDPYLYYAHLQVPNQGGGSMPTSSQAISPREQLDAPEAGRVALKFFFNLMERWGCSAEQQRTLLGGVGNTTFYKYKHLPNIRLPNDTLERISYLMGIHKALSIIFSNSHDRAYTWVSSPNTAAPFNGQTALDYMLAGRVVDIADVRRYLDGVRG
jgi:hypothetical protein